MAQRPPESPTWIGLAGPTASGKSRVALELARHLPIEIVSVDSAQVYRGMDIGTAKPSAAERASVPHHLIDIRDPPQSYSAAAFVADARAAIADIGTRGRLPLLVGGTMLYFHALMHGLDEMPAADPVVRARLDEEAAVRGWPVLHARLAAIDPVTAGRLAPHDAQRIQRALEVFEVSGRPLSAWQRRGVASTTQPSDAPGPIGSRPASILVSLEPTSRVWLHQRIAERFDAMLDAGLLDEVRALRARGDVAPTMPSMRCVGYRQAWDAIDTGRIATLRDAGIVATRQLAKRQLTWLRSMAGRHVVACDVEPQRVFDAALARVAQLAATVAAADATQPGITG